MKTKVVIGSIVGAVAAGAAAYGWLNLSPSESAPTAASATPPLAVLAAQKTEPPFPGATRCQFPQGFKTSYDYEAIVESAMSVQGMPEPVRKTQVAAAKLALEALSTKDSDAVLLAQMNSPNDLLTKMYGDKFGRPFLVKVGPSCELKGFARAKTTPLKTAQGQQFALADLYFRVPKSGAAETTYDNGVGQARATFSTIDGAEVVTRKIKGYESAWRTRNTYAVTTSAATITLNENWVESFRAVEGISGGILVEAKTNTSLSREVTGLTPVSTSASRDENDYEWVNLLSGDYSDRLSSGGLAVPPMEQRYVDAMKNATLESAFASLQDRIEEKANIEDKWHEMTGFLNGHPDQIAEFAEGLKDSEFPQDAKAVSFMALGKAAPDEARVALQGIRSDSSVSPGDRVRASLALVTRQDVGVELAHEMSRDALQASTGDAASDFFPRSTLLHLGVLAAEHRSDSETVAVAREAIASSLQSAGYDTYQLSPALAAAGNLADVGLLSKVVGYTHHPDWHVRELVPKALRGYRYGDVEDVWAEWLARESSPSVKEEIFDVIYHQLADARRTVGPAVAHEAMRHLRMKPLVLARQSIIHLLGPLKDSNREIKTLLMDQLAEEFRSQSGLYSQITMYLAPAEIDLALSMMPEFAHQYGAQARANALAKVRELEAQTAQAATAPRSVLEVE